MKHLPVFNIII